MKFSKIQPAQISSWFASGTCYNVLLFDFQSYGLSQGVIDASREADRQLVEGVYGVDIMQARPIDYLHKLAGRSAIFFINGDADDITPLPGMQALYQAASNPKQNWVVPNAGHAQAFATDPDGYMQPCKCILRRLSG